MATTSKKAKPSKNDPFYEPPLHKAFYHPTKQKNLQDTQKLTALGPERDKVPPDDRDVHFLQPTNTYNTDPTSVTPGDTSYKFNESWPSSERPSTLDTLPDDSGTSIPHHDDSVGPMKPISELLRQYGGSVRPGRSGVPLTDLISEISKVGDTSTLSQTTTSSDPANRISTLSKYIERFRHGEPLSREERKQQKTTDPADFWWLHRGHSGSDSPQGSSTPRTNNASCNRSRVSSSRLSSVQASTHAHQATDLDSDTLRLMEKTDRILEKSTSSLASSAPAVSTVGLGSDVSSSTLTQGDSTGPYEKSYLPSFINTGTSRASLHDGGTRRPMRPDDDILYQWRQQRKMEALRNKASRLLDTTNPPSAEVVDEVESKLAEFRRKALTGQDKPSHTTRTEPQSAFKPRDSHTAPKVDAVCQTSLDATTSGPAPSAAAVHAPVTSTQHQSPVASPSLARKQCAATVQTAQTETTEPHYHLSCDILPCPHPQEHSPKHTHHKPRSHSPKHSSKCDPHTKSPISSNHDPQRSTKHKSYLSDTDTDESRPSTQRGGHKEEPVKDLGPLVIDSCSDAEYEDYKRRHMEEVRSELESCHSQSAGESVSTTHSHSQKHLTDPCYSPKKGYGSRSRSRIKHSEKHKSHYEGEHRDSRDQRKNSKERDPSGRKSSQDRQQERSKSHEKKNTHGRNHEVQTSEFSVSSDKSGNKLDTDRGGIATDQQKSQIRPKSSDRKGSCSGDRIQTGGSRPQHSKGTPTESTRGQSTKPAIGEVVRGSLTDASICDVTPLCHSSPIRTAAAQRAVTPTIQQVVTERLFEDTESKESTSVSDNTLTDNVLDGVLSCSDGEEYPGDEMLQELRARRDRYRHRIQVLDQLLSLQDDS